MIKKFNQYIKESVDIKESDIEDYFLRLKETFGCEITIAPKFRNYNAVFVEDAKKKNIKINYDSTLSGRYRPTGKPYVEIYQVSIKKYGDKTDKDYTEIIREIERVKNRLENILHIMVELRNVNIINSYKGKSIGYGFDFYLS